MILPAILLEVKTACAFSRVFKGMIIPTSSITVKQVKTGWPYPWQKAYYSFRIVKELPEEATYNKLKEIGEHVASSMNETFDTYTGDDEKLIYVLKSIKYDPVKHVTNICIVFNKK